MSLVIAHGIAAAAVTKWDLHPLVVLPLLLTAALYALGVWRLWQRAGIGRGIPRWSVAAFAAGWLTLVVALVSPVAWISEILFSVHMTQHTLLMLVAAPLLAFGQPLLAWLWIFGEDRRDSIARHVRARAVQKVWGRITAPLAVFLLQTAVLWLWHLPSWYQAALHHEAVHALEHVCFVLAGSLFWWAMVRGRYGRMGYGLGVLYVFLTGIHSSGLGALLTVAPAVWYPDYAQQASRWQVDPLADQQLAGLLMWIPAGAIFVVFGLALIAAWLGEAERRVKLGSVHSATRTLAILLAAATLLSACDDSVKKEAESLTGGSVNRGVTAINKYGCGSCHTIPGVTGATATVGPPLTQIAVRQYLAGHLVNTPDNMMKWLQHPQQIDPKNAMPEMGVTDQDARDISAYLYTLR